MNDLGFLVRVTGVIIMTPFILAARAAEKFGNLAAEAMLYDGSIEWSWDDQESLG